MHIAILLATYNGAQFLAEQLDSLSRQTAQQFCVWASDDGSRDGTVDILRAYQKAWGDNKLRIMEGPRQGPAANFLSLACSPEFHADYYAYCDQDDIWLPEKLQTALDWLNSVPDGVPALYAARTGLVDLDGNQTGFSRRFRKRPGFRNALVQNVGGGNTMVFNDSARQLLRRAGPVPVVMHDWWTYLVVSGCGGRVYYDARPLTLYRQHCNNILGSNLTLAAQLRRVRMLWDGEFREWNGLNVAALEAIRTLLTPGNRVILARFQEARGGGLFSRLAGLLRSGVYRQTWSGNLGLLAATVLGRL